MWKYRPLPQTGLHHPITPSSSSQLRSETVFSKHKACQIVGSESIIKKSNIALLKFINSVQLTLEKKNTKQTSIDNNIDTSPCLLINTGSRFQRVIPDLHMHMGFSASFCCSQGETGVAPANPLISDYGTHHQALIKTSLLFAAGMQCIPPFHHLQVTWQGHPPGTPCRESPWPIESQACASQTCIWEK